VSDVAESIHVHGYDMIITLTPGQPAEVTRRSERGFRGRVPRHSQARRQADRVMTVAAAAALDLPVGARMPMHGTGGRRICRCHSSSSSPGPPSLSLISQSHFRQFRPGKAVLCYLILDVVCQVMLCTMRPHLNAPSSQRYTA
jgi:hypothetical protein